MRRALSISVSSLALLFVATNGRADQANYCDDVSFASDLELPETIDLPSFDVDGAGGPYNLLGVTVVVTHSGSADMKIDNDDPAVNTSCRARIIRTFSFNGPGLGLQSGTRTQNSPFQALANDNGDGAAADYTAPDGHDFGSVGYSGLSAGTFNPPIGLYDTNGPSTVSFPIGDDGMGGGLSFSNDFQFTPTTPANRQIDLQNTSLTVQVCVTYDYEAAPPPPMGIPTVSEWGLIILTLLTLTAATLVFGRRGGTVSA